jgi:hypothetical protein
MDRETSQRGCVRHGGGREYNIKKITKKLNIAWEFLIRLRLI